MHVSRSTLRSLTTSCAALALTVTGFALVAPPAQAVGAPQEPQANIRNASTVILSWNPVKNADYYSVQVDTSSTFSSPDYSSSQTKNTKSVPNKGLKPGKNFFRVRANDGGEFSQWTVGTFTVSPVTVPIPLSPGNEAHLQQPQNPPLLQWSVSQGAQSYLVQVDGDSDMVGAKSYTTKTTSLLVPDPLTTGDWYWRIFAVKGDGVQSLPSAVSKFYVDPVALPQITYPADNVNQVIEDFTLDWTPVAGARAYDVQVALNASFTNIALTATNLEGTRYSPPVTLNSDQFWWRVRAVDLGGQPTPWRESVYGFQRQWPDKPVAVYPTGPANLNTVPEPPATSYTSVKRYYQWTPVQHATIYYLQIADDKNFSVNVDTCTTAATTYAPRNTGDCAFRTTSFYWKVIPIDAPYPVGDGLPGIQSEVQKVIWTNAHTTGDWADDPASNLKIAVDGNGIMSGTTETPNNSAGCADDDCAIPVPTTPVLSWDPVPGARSYMIYVAQDINFTTTELPDIPVTRNTMLQLQLPPVDSASTLPDSQVGKAYYWYVRPCTGTAGFDNVNPCGDTPTNRETPFTGTASFSKVSPAVTGLASTNAHGNDIQFDWQDYHTTNLNTTWGNQPSNQTAKNYRIQVDNEPSFATPIDTKVVDQTTYTAYDKLYPDGTYFWRVQALDEEDHGLSWSTTQSFTKSSPRVAPSSPTGGVAVPGDTPFRWSAEPFAALYQLDVFKNNDLTFSSANRILSVTTKTPAYVPATAIPASDSPYVWRVRRQDASGNWNLFSEGASFFSTGNAPNLLSPKAGIWLKVQGSLMEWTEVPGAASYDLNVSGPAGFKVNTVATAYAPREIKSGTYTWNVTAKDSSGNALATSATRQFQVDETAPQVKKLKPATLKPTSVLKAVFTEKVKGASEKSIKLYRLKGTKKVKVGIKVKVLKKGKAASIDPKGRLKKGDYVLVFTKKIKDARGNRMVKRAIELSL